MLVINSSTLLCVDLEGLGGGGRVGGRWGGREAPPGKVQVILIYVVKLPKICLGAPPRINVLDPRMSACLVISNTPKLLDIS